MPIATTVFVTYDAVRNKLTLRGGNTAASNGACNLDPGPGNEITFEPAGANAGDWTLTEVTWTPDTPDVLKATQSGDDIVVTDNDNEPVTKPVAYNFTVYGAVGGNQVASDPVIVNKPTDGMKYGSASGGSR